MSNTNTPINIPVRNSSETSNDPPETQDEEELIEQQLEHDAALADQQQQTTVRQLRAQKLQDNKSKVAGKVPPSAPKKKIGIFSFAAMFCLALIKDLIDLFDWGILGTITNFIPIMGILLIVVITGGSLMDFMNKKKYILASGAALEFVPLIGFLPIWTLSIFWLFIESKRGKAVSGKAATRFGKKVAKGKRVQSAVKKFKK